MRNNFIGSRRCVSERNECVNCFYDVILQDQSVNVTICVEDVNDNPPTFNEEYSWSLTENEDIVNATFQV